MKQNKNNFMVTIIVAVIVAAVAFFGGMKYQQMQVTAGVSANGSQYGQGGQGQGGQGGQGGARRGQFGNRNGGATVGEVVSLDANSITVKLQDGSSKIVNIAATTTYSKTDTASSTDVKSGDRIAAFGPSNSDGSITAQNIQLNPMFMNRGGTPGVSGQPPQGK
jgi:Cu/Ag efflux protein CusF